MHGGRWTAVGRGHPRGGARTRRLGTIPGKLVAALLAVALLVSCGISSPPTARADPQHDVKISLTKVSPSVVKPDSTVVFKGRVKNTSDRPLLRLQASIWRSLVPLTTHAQLNNADKSAPGSPAGQLMYRGSDASTDLFTKSEPELAPGKSVQFRVRAKAKALLKTPDPNNGVYLAGIKIRENGRTVGRSRTYLPVQTDDAAKKWRKDRSSRKSRVSTASLVKLSAKPTMARDKVFMSNSLARQVSAGGRLDKLLSAAAKSKTSYAIDPNLLTELRTMADGYRVVDRHGKSHSGSGAPAAKSWLKRFKKLQRSQDGFRLPYAQPDLAALLHTRSRAQAKRVATTGEHAAHRVRGAADLPLLIAPPKGKAPSKLLSLAADLDARAVLLSNDTANGHGIVLAAHHGPKILRYHTGTDIGPGPDPRDTPVQQRQTWLARSYVDASGKQDESSQPGRLRVIDNAKQVKRHRPLRAPWLVDRNVSELLKGDSAKLNQKPTYPPPARKAELGQQQLHKVTGLQRDLHLYRQLLADPKSVDPKIQPAVPRAASSAWRGHTAAMRKFLRHQDKMLKKDDGHAASLTKLRRGHLVYVESNPQITLTGASGTLPATLVNRLNVAVKVRLNAQSPNPSRLYVRNLSSKKLGTIKAGDHRPAQIGAEAKSNGTLPIALQLANTDNRPLGPKLTIQVNATRAGMIGWVIVIGAGIVLLGTVALRVRQVRRERPRSNASTGSDNRDDTTTTTPIAEQNIDTEDEQRG